MMTATVRFPWETLSTVLAICWIRPVASAPAMTMKRPTKNIREGHSTSFSSISTMSTLEMASSSREPIRAATDTCMCRKPCMMKSRMVKPRRTRPWIINFLSVILYSSLRYATVRSTSLTSAFKYSFLCHHRK